MPSLVEIRNLSVHFPVKSGLLQRQTGVVKALNDVSLKIDKGSTLGLVGESGSGKTTLGRVLVRLQDPTSNHLFGWLRPAPLPQKDPNGFSGPLQLPQSPSAHWYDPR
ncbi:MAG: ATP-binding cassette domain-containing protein [Verrucomicrobia bacterium]|nr:ATP-binding cassette domain-containing protein [Verrucomicrobiota bacterium]